MRTLRIGLKVERYGTHIFLERLGSVGVKLRIRVKVGQKVRDSQSALSLGLGPKIGLRRF